MSYQWWWQRYKHYKTRGERLCELGHHKIVYIGMDVEESSYPVERHCARPRCPLTGRHIPR